MISDRDFKDSTSQKRRKMTARLKEKLWRTGKRAGMVRRPARELPFSLEEFRAWTMQHVGMGMARCHYCPRAIDVLSFEPDHFVPLELGGGIDLDNLVPACEDCNRIKGAMPPHDFVALMNFLDSQISAVGRADIKKRLRVGAMGLRLRHQPAAAPPKIPPQSTKLLTPQEMDF
jgi:5-methylcytosine-specific restriction endonuclease McrA